MGFPFYKSVYTQDSTLARIQTSVKDCFEWIMGRPGIRSVEVEVALTTGANTVYHKLGFIPRGYYIVKSNADVRVWNTSAPANDKMELQSSGNATVTLVVY